MYRDGALGVPTSEEMAAFAGHDEWVRMSGEALGVREWYMRDRSTLEDLALAVLLTTGTEGPTVDGIRCRSLTAGETAIRIADAVLRAGYHTHSGQDDAVNPSPRLKPGDFQLGLHH